jgi:phenylacetate-CoA ligase
VSGDAGTVELSVVAPCLNEEANLPLLVERLTRTFEAHRIAGEIVLVDDGSTDGTGPLADRMAAADPRVVAVHHPTNRGIPAGWQSGLAHARGRYVCTIDADLQYQPEDVARLLDAMHAGDVDLVQGRRLTVVRDHRYYMSRGLDLLLKLAFRMPEHDVKSGFILYKREVLEDILRDVGRFHHFQHMLTVVAKARGYRIRQIETRFEERHAGQSFIGRFPARMLAQTLADIVHALAAYPGVRARTASKGSSARRAPATSAAIAAGSAADEGASRSKASSSVS